MALPDERRFDMIGDPLEVDLSPCLVSLIDEVRATAPRGTSLDCGDLLAACFLDPTTHGVASMVERWCGQGIARETVLDAVRSRTRAVSAEGPRNSCVVGGLVFDVTTWASLVLRFLSTCGSYPHGLLLLAGLLEFDPPSVEAMLEHLGLDGRALRAGAGELRVRMKPALASYEDPFVQDAQYRYFTWQHSSEGLSEPISRFPLPRTSDELVVHMLAWLADEYREVPVQPSYLKGDVVLFAHDRLQDLYVLGVSGVWHSLTGRTSGGTMASCGRAARVFRVD